MLSLFALSGGSWLFSSQSHPFEGVHFAKAEAKSGLVKMFSDSSSEFDPQSLSFFINEEGYTTEVSFLMSEATVDGDDSSQALRYQATPQGKLLGAGILVSKRFMAEHHFDFPDASVLAKFTPEDSLEIIQRITHEKQRSIQLIESKLAWPGGSLWLVQFEPERQNALVSLCLVSDEGLSFFDMPASTHRVKNVWQRGDHGVFNLEGFKPFALIRRGDQVLIAVVWHRFEADRMLCLRQEGSELKVEVQEDLSLY